MLTQPAKFRVGEFVDVNHKGNAMQITSCKYNEDRGSYYYFLNSAKDGAGFHAHEHELKTVEKDELIYDLVRHLNENTANWLKTIRERDELLKEESE